MLGQHERALRLEVLSTTDPDAIRMLADRLDLDRTLFIVASKSGTTAETLALFDFFWERVPSGRHFVAITDAGTGLQGTAHTRSFRRVFVNPTNIRGRCEGTENIGGRYSALCYFGLVPAVLAGVPLRPLLACVHEMGEACHPCVAVGENPAAWLGAVMGEAAQAGRDKLTLLLPEALAALGPWVEQLVAESTGKRGRGILPVVGEPLGRPEVYRDDRLFVAVGARDGVEALEAAGHPVVRLPARAPKQLGGEFLRWEFATAVAGHVLRINPFDQPNVQEAKDATARILAGERPETSTLPLDELLAGVKPGGYIALLVYQPRKPDLDGTLKAVRLRLRERYRVATTVGYGPSYLHSTGQLHKGGPQGGAFVIVMPQEVAPLSIPERPYDFGGLERAQAVTCSR
ncbi:MAG: glucose-6-phosphate isomerase [Dehalococcoidia bacterium]|nr:glucose-6-phosphate isomerase [Dehalococcoidia bacterium]